MEIIEEQLSRYGHGGLTKVEATKRNPSNGDGDSKVPTKNTRPSEFEIDPIISTLEAIETREIVQKNLLHLVR